MEILIMRGDKLFAVTHFASAIPRNGDTMLMDGVKVKVKEVIWHVEETRTWVEVQI